MANQNLSQFTEKLFVADADHTFIWDTANAISKRVSRNSWLNSGTLTSDAPVTISQTWNGTGSTVFKALVVNAVATGTTSSALSSLLDLQTSGASQLSFGQGFITFSNTSANVPASGFCMGVAGGQYMLLRAGNSSNQFTFSGTGLSLDNENHAIFFGGGVATAPRLYKDASYTLALRNGGAAQTFNVYGTWTTAITNFERLAIKYNTTDVAYQIAAEKGTTNGDYRPLQLWTGGASRLHITTAGNVGIGTTNPSTSLEVAGNGRFTGTYPYMELKPSAWANSFYFQSGTDAVGIGTGVYTIFGNPPAHGFSWAQGPNSRMAINTAGNVGIGTTSPSSKLQVTGGDVEIETVTSGIIMKAAGTSTRYRITLNATGDALVFTAI